MSTETTAQTVNNWYTAMGVWDTDTVMGTLADDVIFELGDKPYMKVIPYLRTWVGKDAFAEASKLRVDTADITGYELRSMIAQGNKATALIWSRAVCKETGIEFELEVVHFLELNDDGKIAKVTAVFDPVPEINAFTGKA